MKHPFHNVNQPVKCWLSQVLVVLLLTPGMMTAQAPVGDVKPAPTTQSLKVIPLAGNEEMNDLQRRIMAPLVVQVLDQESRPVEGADVTFRFPVQGPGATFSDGKTSQTIRTNADGQAAATGWTANSTTGRFQLQVTASRGNDLGNAILLMTNVTSITEEISKKKPKSFWSSKWTKIGLIAGAAAIITVVVLVTRGDNGPSSTTITAVPGFPTIGGAQ